MLPHGDQIVFRHSEVRVDRVQALDHQQRPGVGSHHVAQIHQPLSRAAGDRRANEAIVQIQTGCFHGRLRLLDLGFGDVHGVLADVEVLLSDGPFLNQARGADGLDPGQVQRRFGLGEVGQRRVELGLVRTRVNDEKRVAGFQVRAVLEVDFGDAA